MQLEKYIYNLLVFGNNEVSVPSFGVFKTTYHFAKIHLTTNIAHPPKKTLEFESTPLEKDTLLQKYISEVEHIKEETVKLQIQKAVMAWKKALETTNLTLEHLGTIISKGKNNFLFVKKRELDILPSAFGLETVPFNIKKSKLDPPTVSSETLSSGKKQHHSQENLVTNHFENALETNTLETPNEIYQEYYRKVKINNMKRNFLVSAIIALIVLLMVYFILDPFNSEEDLSSLTQVKLANSEIVSNSVDSATQVNVTPEDSITSKNLVISKTSQKVTENASDKMKGEATTIEASNNKHPNYYVMAGSFRFDSNAHKFLKQLKSLGYNKAVYLGKSKNGLYRVSYGSFYNKSKAQHFLKQIRLKLDQKAWLLISKNDQEK